MNATSISPSPVSITEGTGTGTVPSSRQNSVEAPATALQPKPATLGAAAPAAPPAPAAPTLPSPTPPVSRGKKRVPKPTREPRAYAGQGGWNKLSNAVVNMRCCGRRNAALG